MKAVSILNLQDKKAIDVELKQVQLFKNNQGAEAVNNEIDMVVAKIRKLTK
jgi:hypothetical protein